MESATNSLWTALIVRLPLKQFSANLIWKEMAWIGIDPGHLQDETGRSAQLNLYRWGWCCSGGANFQKGILWFAQRLFELIFGLPSKNHLLFFIQQLVYQLISKLGDVEVIYGTSIKGGRERLSHHHNRQNPSARAEVLFIRSVSEMGLSSSARYLISLWTVCLRRLGLYFFFSKRSGWVWVFFLVV